MREIADKTKFGSLNGKLMSNTEFHISKRHLDLLKIILLYFLFPYFISTVIIYLAHSNKLENAIKFDLSVCTEESMCETGGPVECLPFPHPLIGYRERKGKLRQDGD